MDNIRLLITWHEAYMNWLQSTELTTNSISAIYNGTIILITIVGSIILYYLVSKLIYCISNILVKKKGGDMVNSLLENKFFSLLGYYAPLMVVRYNLRLMLHNNESIPIIDKCYQIAHVVLFLLIANSLLNTFVQVNQYKVQNHSKPIKGLVQFSQIILYFCSGIIIISILVNKNLPTLLGGLGAASAVLMLIFKDSIMGVVAGVQLSFNKMIEIGDWISIAKYDVDGEVIDITITSVKVRNWDKTISTVPSYNLVATDSVKNWKAMVKGNTRRMTPIFNIDLLSIKFCTVEMLERYKQIKGVEEALNAAPKLSNKKSNAKTGSGNNNTLTNLGVFRAYIYYYLKHNEDINQKQDVIVQQLQPNNFGLPVQLYCFTTTSKWRMHEDVRSDIIDHVLAILPNFDLNIFQSPKDPRNNIQKVEIEMEDREDRMNHESKNNNGNHEEEKDNKE